MSWRFPFFIDRFKSDVHSHISISNGFSEVGIAWKRRKPADVFCEAVRVHKFQPFRTRGPIYWWTFKCGWNHRFIWPTFKDQPNYAEPFEIRINQWD